MELKTLLICLLYLTQTVLSDECVTNTFEEDFDILFDDGIGACSTVTETWKRGNYSSISIERPDLQSETFIYPSNVVSCIASFPFNISTEGTLQVHVYMDLLADPLTVLVQANIQNNPTRGFQNLNPSAPGFQSGWQLITVEMIGDGSFEGFVSFMGSASENSVVLIDSFRYIPPTLDEENCLIYQDNGEDDQGGGGGDEDGGDQGGEEVDQGGEDGDQDGGDQGGEEVDQGGVDGVQGGDGEENGDGEEPEDQPVIDEPSNSSFWNALTISIVAIAIFIILAVLCYIFYEIGRRRAVKEDPTSVFMDYDKLPKPVLVPRVTKLYTDTNMLNVYDRSNPNNF